MKRVALVCFTAAICNISLFGQDTIQPSVSVQDATVAAPLHYHLEYENELVRIVRVTYGPHEKSPMHAHKGNAVVIVVLKGGAQISSITEDGARTPGRTEQTGAVRFVPSRPAFVHSSENVTNLSLETIRVELKTPLCSDKQASH